MSLSYKVLTNRFRVTDADKLKTVIADCLCTDDEELQLYEHKENGEILYSFGADGGLRGIPAIEEVDDGETTRITRYVRKNNKDYDYDCEDVDIFFKLLQALLLADDSDDANTIGIVEVSGEGMDFKIALATVITHKKIKQYSVMDELMEAACKYQEEEGDDDGEQA